jgi:hypothetical protein
MTEKHAFDRLHNVVAQYEAAKPAIHAAGLAAVVRLVPIAQKDTGQSVTIAKFLLGVYNGRMFPFDLTNLRNLDIDLHNDCLAVLRMDHSALCEIHLLVNNGPATFEQLARDWAPSYSRALTDTANSLGLVREPS